MVASGWGRIVMISSSSAQRGSPFAAHYARLEGAADADPSRWHVSTPIAGSRVNNIPPSGIEAPMQHAGQGRGFLESNEEIAANIPVGHLGTGDDIATAVAFPCSEEAKFITGQTLGSQRREQ